MFFCLSIGSSQFLGHRLQCMAQDFVSVGHKEGAVHVHEEMFYRWSGHSMDMGGCLCSLSV